MTAVALAPLSPKSRAALLALLEAGKVQSPEHPAYPPADIPLVTPDRTLYMQVTENDVHRDYDGGRVVLTLLGGREDRRLIGATLTLVYDGTAAGERALWEYPAFREDERGTVYEVLIRERTWEDVPPNPDDQPAPDPALARLEAENQRLRAQLAERTAEPAVP